MKKLTVLVYMLLSSWASAQDATCISRSQFLKGEFTAGSVPCDPLLAVPLTYCNASVFDPSERLEFYTESDLRNYFPPVLAPEDESIEVRMARTDSMRIMALLDDANSESVRGLFYLLNTAILAAQISDIADTTGLKADFGMLINKELEGRYFIDGLPKSVSELERISECAVRCGNSGADMEKLTRSPVFSSCTGGIVTSTY